ncbi:7643_t:CDS:1 [Diversispora eburnea]|uniref:7643_t:CDS:1 n=1 Tax=Diversispora eburnea TaxID=1213867 RepID=A0A9N9GGA6_9GLOM|nr:7643_t:CDS:1 [Diversispora eburnea]
MATARKIQNSKTNSFTSILNQILKKYNLSVESDPSQLRAHANELGTMLSDWKARKDVKEALRQCLFKGNQIEALVPDKRGKKLTIKERARYCATTGDAWDIWLHTLDLVMPKNNTDEVIVAASSRVSQFRRELAEAGVDSEQIDIYAKLLKVTRASNEIQKRQLE